MKTKKEERKSSLICVKLSDSLLSEIDELIKGGVYVTKSEIVREALRLLVEKYRRQRGGQGERQEDPHFR